MSNTKKRQQHFVPKFYLKRFSHDGKGKQLSLWSGVSQLYVKDARLSDQAYADNFYGADGSVEDTLSVLESKVAGITAQIMRDGLLPVTGSEEHLLLYTFVMFQAERTKAGASDMETTADQMMRFFFKEDPRFEPYLPHIKLKLLNPGAQKLALVSPLVPLCLDLAAKLLINEGAHEFVTSDNPVVRYNQFTEARNWPSSGAGWSMPGLQVFFPLSPKHVLLLYDSDMYSFPDASGDIQIVKSLSDINWINGLQYLVADENVYFSTGIDELYATRMHQRWAKYRRPRYTVNEYERTDPRDPSKKGTILMTTFNNIRIGLQLSFVKFAVDPETRKLGPTLWNPRNKYVEEVLLTLEKDRYKPTARAESDPT